MTEILTGLGRVGRSDLAGGGYEAVHDKELGCDAESELAPSAGRRPVSV